MSDFDPMFDEFDDDDDFDLDDPELDDFNEQAGEWEPEGQPEPNVLLPDLNSEPIEAQRLNPDNVRQLLALFCHMVRQRDCQPAPMPPVAQIDVLEAMFAFIRLFTLNTVLRVTDENPTAAVCNRTLVLKKLEELNDEILQLDLNSPKVN